MKKLKIISIFLFGLFILTSCSKEEYNINEEITLKGTITNSEIIRDNEKFYVSILNLDKPITINGTTVNKIELEYDKGLKENKEITLTGIIEENNDSNVDLKYSFSVLDIDDILSYINIFSNDDFSMTIPPALIKISTIKEVENGYIIYSSSNIDVGGEVFRILAVSREEYNSLRKNKNVNIETLESNNKKVIIMVFPKTDEYTKEHQDEYAEIANQANKIKNTIRIK